MLAWALWYAAMGMFVHPCDGKAPFLKDWPNLSSRDEDKIREWWTKWPNANIGLNPGKSGLVAIDVDSYKGGELDLDFDDKQTVTTITGGGGEHLLYNANGIAYGNSFAGEGVAIDVKGVGGNLILPPSVHPKTGRRYEWEPGYGPDERTFMIVPEALKAMLTVKGEYQGGPVLSLNGAQLDREAKRARVALTKLAAWRCENYEPWIKIGMALKALGPIGLILWDEFSAQSSKYEPGACEFHWQSFNRTGEGDGPVVTLNSLYHWVEEDRPTFRREGDESPFDAPQSHNTQHDALSIPDVTGDDLTAWMFNHKVVSTAVRLSYADRELFKVELKKRGCTQRTLSKWSAAIKDAAPNRNDKPTSADYISALAKLGYSFRVNDLNDNIEVNGRDIDDIIAAEIRAKMRDEGFSSMEAMQDAYALQANTNRYHPLKEWLSNLQWDGVDHIAHLANYIETEHNPIVYRDGKQARVVHVWLRRWLVASVARLFEQKENRLLVMDGAQDLGKSHLVQWLARPIPAYFVEGPIKPDDKDNLLRLASLFVWEVAELGATTRRADREALKHFITARTVTVRKPYGRFEITKPAIVNLFGTVNNENGFLQDPTGNRRFLVFKATAIDWNYAKDLQPEQVWAQAMALYNAGEDGSLSLEEKVMQRLINAGYHADTSPESYIDYLFIIDPKDTDSFMPTVHIAQVVQDADYRGNSNYLMQQINASLMRRGLQKRKIQGKMSWVGIKKDPVARPVWKSNDEN